MNREIGRVIAGSQISNMVAVVIMLYSIPRMENEIDALVVMPGQGENWRVQEAISVWNRHSSSARYLLMSGQYEKKWASLDLENLKKEPFNLKRSHGFYSQIFARNTKEQAVWIVEKVREIGVKSIALFVSPYHLLRAYCTLLQTFNITHTPWILMFPAPVAISPDTPIPETGVSAWDLVPGELERIIQYQKRGDVCNFDQLREYISWLWMNFPKKR